MDYAQDSLFLLLKKVDSMFLCRDNLIAASSFGFIEGLIGLSNKLGEGGMLIYSRDRGDSQADGQVSCRLRMLIHEFIIFHGEPYFFPQR